MPARLDDIAPFFGPPFDRSPHTMTSTYLALMELLPILVFAAWESFRVSRQWKPTSHGLTWSVGVRNHAVAEVVAEAPTDVARAFLYILT